MCAVSMVMDYGINRWPEPQWTEQGINQFKKLVKEAEEFDRQTDQPDCVDPEKEKFLQKLEIWIAQQRGSVRS